MRSIAINAVQQVIKHFNDEIVRQIDVVEARLEQIATAALTVDQQNYITLLKNDIRTIITADPERLSKLRVAFDEFIPGEKMAEDDHKDFRDMINDHLWYKHWRGDYYPAYFAKLGLKACVYCNAQPTLVIKRKKKGLEDLQAKLQVDHYLAKKAYPCFSIALFNLYPVCASCNQVKSTKNILFDLYVKEPGASRYNFYLEKDKGIYLNTRSLDDITVLISGPDLPTQGDYYDYAELFGLEGIYQHYRDIAGELILKAEIYTPDYKKTLLSTFSEYLKHDNIDRMITGNYTEENAIHDRPLAKFVRDISIDVGLIPKND